MIFDFDLRIASPDQGVGENRNFNVVSRATSELLFG